MEKALKYWFTHQDAPLSDQESARRLFFILMLVLIVMAVIFGPMNDFVPIEDLW